MLAEEHCSILIAGAGPAGIAAACAAAGSGASVVLLDDNPAPGGQIWRGEEKTPGGSKRDWMVRLSRFGARVYTATRAIAPIGPGLLLAERNCEPLLIHYGKLILATGARHRSVRRRAANGLCAVFPFSRGGGPSRPRAVARCRVCCCDPHRERSVSSAIIWPADLAWCPMSSWLPSLAAKFATAS